MAAFYIKNTRAFSKSNPRQFRKAVIYSVAAFLLVILLSEKR